MKRLFLIVSIALLGVVGAFGQEKMGGKGPTDADKTAAFDKDGKIKRGAELGDSEMVSLNDVFSDPAKFEGKTVRVDGFVVRSCTKEGCWAEIGAEKDSKQTVRVTMKDHGFFIPLSSAGFKVSTEGMFEVATLSAEKVKHLIEDDGAKFDKINEDGTVTEVSFVASGIVLTKE
ncbi:MAG: DUF4920 domain-containing protein [Pyrinomonadaceae bacterium]